MCDIETLNYYKGILKTYKYHLKQYIKLDRELEALQVERMGVHSIRYDSEAVQGSSDPLNKELHIDDLRDEIELVTIKRELQRRELVKLLDYINLMDKEISKSVFKIYCLKTSTIGAESRKLYMSVKTLRRKIDKEIQKIANSES